MRINITVVIVAFISFTSLIMAGLMFLLLPGPDEIIRRMQVQLLRSETFTVDAVLTFEGARIGRDANYVLTETPESFEVRTKSVVDRRPEHAAFAHTVSLTDTVQASTTAAGELRRVDGKDFLRIDEMADDAALARLGDLEGQWLSYDLDRLREAIDAPLFGSSGTPLTIEQRAELLRRVETTPLLGFLRREEDVGEGAARVYHFVVQPEPLYAKDLFTREERMRLGRDLTYREQLALDTFFGNLTPLPSEVWIAKRGYVLQRAMLRFQYDDGRRVGEVALDVAFSGYGLPVEVALPSGRVRDVDALFAALLPGIVQHLPLAKEGGMRQVRAAADEPAYGGLLQGSVDAGRSDGDEDGLTDDVEYFFGSDPANADTDGDGVADGAEVEAGSDPIGPGKLFDFGIEKAAEDAATASAPAQ